MEKINDMKRYGLSEAFTVYSEGFKDLTVSRVISQQKGLYRLISEYGEKNGQVSGKFHYNVHTISEYPAVGDFVMTDWNEKNDSAVIHQVLPRRSCFMRKAAGGTAQEQVVAANIDTAFLCMALNNDFNLRRLERYLAIAWSSGATPVIVLTKSDLCSDLDSRLSAISSVASGADVLVTSCINDLDFEVLYPYITEGKTSAFIGSSGVGKSTIINCLMHENLLNTGSIRSDGRGRHTTTHRELFLLPCGGMVIDTPGMRELGMWDAGDGINTAFSDIDALALKCRFRNCTHSGEPGCAVLKAADNGLLSAERLRSYQKLMCENRYIEDTEDYLAEKREKFKKIAKYNKNLHKR